MQVFDKFQSLIFKLLKGQLPDENISTFDELEYQQMLSILQTFQFLCVYESYPPFKDAQAAKALFLEKEPPIEKSNFFPNLQVRFFSERGELKNLNSLNYKEFLFQLRNEIAHHRFTTHILKDLRTFVLRVNKIKFDISAIFNDKFVEYLSEIPFQEKTAQEFKFLYVPKGEKPVETEEECKTRVEGCKMIKISLKEPANLQAIKTVVHETLLNLSEDKNAFEKIKSCLKEKIGQDTKIEFSDLPETQALILRLAKDKTFYCFDNDPETNRQMQDNFITEVVEKVYDFSIVEKQIINTHGKIGYLTIQPQMLHDMICKLKDILKYFSKQSQDETLDLSIKHFAPECAVLLCELNILDKMVITKYSDTAKHAYMGKFMSSEDLKQTPGTMRQLITYSEMNNFEIVKKRNKKKPDSLYDKDFVLRKIRNSVHYQGMSFQLNKSGNLENIHIKFQNPTQQNPSYVVVEYSHLLSFLNQFIKELESQQSSNLCKDAQVLYTDEIRLIKNAVRVCVHKNKKNGAD